MQQNPIHLELGRTRGQTTKETNVLSDLVTFVSDVKWFRRLQLWGSIYALHCQSSPDLHHSCMQTFRCFKYKNHAHPIVSSKQSGGITTWRHRYEKSYQQKRERNDSSNDRQRKRLLVPWLFHVMIAERSADATIRRIRPTHTGAIHDHRKGKQEMAVRRVSIIPWLRTI